MYIYFGQYAEGPPEINLFYSFFWKIPLSIKQCVGPAKIFLFTDLDPTSKVIPDPTSKVTPDPIPVPGQNQLFDQVNNKVVKII